MGKLGSFGKVLECLNLPSGTSCSCLCFNSCGIEEEDNIERKPLIAVPDHQAGQLVRLKDVLKPKMVLLKVSMHCNGCARKVEKHISKMEGVTSYQIDLETKMVVVIGDIIPCEVLESISKVKYAELWTAPPC